MEDNIRKKIVNLYFRFLKEYEHYDRIKIMLKNFNIKQMYSHVKTVTCYPYVEQYSDLILSNMFTTNSFYEKINNDWEQYCKEKLLIKNVDELWEDFKQTEYYKTNESIIKYDESDKTNFFNLPQTLKKFNCSVLYETHYYYIELIIKANSYKNISELFDDIDNLNTTKFIKKWEEYYNNNLTLKL